MCHLFFFFNDTATTEIYTLALHDALPILEFTKSAKHVSPEWPAGYWPAGDAPPDAGAWDQSVAQVKRDLQAMRDRKSTRLNSSHSQISYAVFCLKKKNQIPRIRFTTTRAS